jgi:hypothetical protein
MTEKKLTEKFARSGIPMQVKRPPNGLNSYPVSHAASFHPEFVQHGRRLSVFTANHGRQVMVGPALTVRNIVQREHPYETAKARVNKRWRS